MQEWSLLIERELFRNTVFEARYVGNKGVKLIRVFDINEVNVYAVDPVTNASFVDAFMIAQKNLAVSRAAGGSGSDNFAFRNLAGQQANPFFTRLFGGAGASLTTNSTFTTAVAQGEAGELADLISRQAVGGVRPGLILNAGLPINFLRANPDVRSAFFGDNASRSTFHALQLEVRRRFMGGFSLQANYQFGKELTDFSGSVANDRSIVSLRRTDFEYGPQSPFHQFRANFIYELPLGKGRRFINQGGRGGLVNLLLGGFQFGGIVRYESGTPLSITAGLGTLNRTGRSDRDSVDLVPGVTYDQLRDALGVRTDSSGRIVYFDSGFNGLLANPQPGTLGNLGRGVITGPSFFTTDFSVIKRAGITETQNVEFRAEFFNVFNDVNFGFPNTNRNNANFGVIDSIRGEPRIVHSRCAITSK